MTMSITELDRSLRALRLFGMGATLITSHRSLDDWAWLIGELVVVGPLIDRLMHHGHRLELEDKSWRLKEAAARIAKRGSDE